MVFDESLPDIDERYFTKLDWTEFYGDAKENLPPNAPEPRGKALNMYCFVDANHAGDKITHHSQTGILIFLNHAPIQWYSKHQNMVDCWV